MSTFKTTIGSVIVLFMTNLNAADAIKPAHAQGVTEERNRLQSQGAITIQGNSRAFTPLASEAVEKLGRDGVRRKLTEQQTIK